MGVRSLFWKLPNVNLNKSAIKSIFTHADGSRGSIAMNCVCVCDSVCLSVRTIKPKRLKLKSPNLIGTWIVHRDTPATNIKPLSDWQVSGASFLAPETCARSRSQTQDHKVQKCDREAGVSYTHSCYSDPFNYLRKHTLKVKTVMLL